MKSATRCSAARSPEYAPCRRTNEPGILTGSTRAILAIMHACFAGRRRPALIYLSNATRLVDPTFVELRPLLLAHEMAFERLRAVGRRPLLGRLQIRGDLRFERRVRERGPLGRGRDLVDARLREHDHLSDEIERQRDVLVVDRARVRRTVLVHV